MTTTTATPHPFYVHAHTLRSQGKTAEALTAYGKLLQTEPEHFLGNKEIASVLFRLSRPKDAIPYLMKAGQINPQDADIYNNLGAAHIMLGNPAEAVKILRAGLKIAPENISIHNNLGTYYVSDHKYDQALQHYYEIIRLQPDNENARQQLRFLHQKTVPSWHFDMMNDQERNDAFETAIRKAVNKDTVVLEIGTGSGLLAMMAARAGAKHVYTCEKLLPIARVASTIVAKNGLADNITVLRKVSTDLKIGIDLPEKADVLIAEILGTSMLQEEILPFLKDARERLLKPNAAIIPLKGTFYAAPVESPKLLNKSRVYNVSGFDLSPFNGLYDEPCLQVPLSQYAPVFLAEPVEIFQFDFRRTYDKERRDIPLPITRSGTCHGIAQWYTLFTDEDTSINTRPKAVDTHWQQGFQPLAAPVKLAEGETATLSAYHDCKRIGFALTTR